MKIDVNPELEKALIAQARKRGTSPELLAIDCLLQRFVGVRPADGADAPRKSLADALGDYVGGISSREQTEGGAQLSQSPGKRFAEGMAKKREQGRI